MTTARRIWLVAGVIGVGLALAHARAQGQAVPQIKEVPCEQVVSVDGRDNFTAYCAVCHGADGKGHGPAVPALKVAVPDLTTIAKRAGGKFNAIAVERALAGVDKLPPAHGSVTMPMWGQLFHGADLDKHVTTLRLQNLVKHLESIQAK